jgi:hypothetical protein
MLRGDGSRPDKRPITAMNNRLTLKFWLSQGELNAPRAYLGTSPELGALLSHLIAERRVNPDMENASRAERCTCGKPWDNCPLKALRGKLHPSDVALWCRLMRVDRQRLETQRRPWWQRLIMAVTFRRTGSRQCR